MNERSKSLKPTTDRELLITRVFDAPREMVFKAWTDPKHLAHWYAPNGCTLSFAKIDARPGGTLHYCISNPEFGDCIIKGIYREVKFPERIVHTQHFSDEAGNFIEPKDSHLKMEPDWPREIVLTVTFTEENGKTKMTLHQTVSEVLAKRTGAYPSWLQMFDRLDENLAKEKQHASKNQKHQTL